MAVKTEALSIFALLLSAPGGFLPLDKDLSWMTQGDHHHHSVPSDRSHFQSNRGTAFTLWLKPLRLFSEQPRA